LLDGRRKITFHPGDTRHPAGTFPGLAPGWNMTALFAASGADAQGPIAIMGDEAGGAGLYIENGRPNFLYNATTREAGRFTLTGPSLTPGDHNVTISMTATPSAGLRAARVAMLIDGKEVAARDVAIFYPVRGGGVVGRYGVRTLLAGLSNPAPHGLAIDRVEFVRR
jgi:arylsulfatase